MDRSVLLFGMLHSIGDMNLASILETSEKNHVTCDAPL